MPHANFQVIARATRDLDIALPDALTTAVEQADALVEAVDDIGGGPQRLQAAALDAIAAGRTLATDKAVQQLLAEHVLVAHTGLTEAARQRHDASIDAAIAAAASALLASMHNALQPHADALTAAVRADITDLEDPPHGSVDTYQRWLDARQANMLFNTAISAAMTLMRCSHVGTDARHGRVLLLAPADDVVLDSLRATSTANPDAFSLARAGLTPSLVRSTDEYLDRCNAIQAALAAAAARDAAPPQRPIFTTFG